MSTDHDPQAMLVMAWQAFARAKERYEATEHSKDMLDVFAPLCEALWWARSVDEGFEETDDRSEYEALRDAHADGRVMRGLRFARNRSGHQRAMTVEQTDGATWPMKWPVSWVSVTWRPLDDLPTGYPDSKGEEHYKKYLAGDAASNTLDAAARWFVFASERPGTNFPERLRGTL